MKNHSNNKPKLPFWSLERLFWLCIATIGMLGFFYLQWAEVHSRVKLWVPNRELPPYTQIQATDLTEKEVAARTISSDYAKEVGQICGRYTLVTAPKGKPLSRNNLGPKLTLDSKRTLLNSLLIAIPATYTLTLGGSLKAGDLVDLSLVPPATNHCRCSSVINFPHVLVLDVKPEPSTKLSGGASVLIIALPLCQQRKYAAYSPGASILIAKRP